MRIAWRGTIGAAVVALTATACRDVAGPEPIYTRHRAVFGVLEVGAADVRVLAEELSEGGARVPLRGADATLTGLERSTPLIEAAVGQPCFVSEAPPPGVGEDGCYGARLPGPIAAAQALALQMLFPDGSEVRGSLVTPEPPAAWIPPDSQSVMPFWGDRHPLDRQPRAIVPIVLEAAPGARRVDVVAKAARGFRPGGGVDQDPECQLQASTTPFRAPELRGEHAWNFYELVCLEGGPWDSLGLDVHVISMEANYADYFDRVLGSNAFDASRAGFGLEGAVGVFGAVATTMLSLTLRY